MASVNLINTTVLDMTVYAGDTMTPVTITFTDSVTTLPIDLTNVVFKMDIKKTFLQSVPNESLIMGDGITLSGGSHNIITLKKIINLKGGDYVYDFQGTWPNGDVITYLNGAFTIQQDVTDSSNEV